MKLGVLASGEGSTLQAVLDASNRGDIDASVRLVISNNSNAGALERAAQCGIKTLHISSATHTDESARDQAITQALVRADVELVLLAGYMKRLGPQVLETFAGRIINTHPSLLPKYGGQGFYGRRVHEAVLEAGDTATGATVHIVTADYDAGPIVGQVTVPVRKHDTLGSLETRVKNAERNLLLQVISDWRLQTRDQGPRMANVMPGD